MASKNYKNLVRNVRGEHLRQAIRLLQSINANYSRGMYDVFRDFVAMAALAIANRVPVSKEMFEQRTARYLAISKGYSPEQMDAFSKALAEVVMDLEESPKDAMGELYMGLNISDGKCKGQFFTPFDISKLLARMGGALDAVREAQAEGRICEIYEPCVGAGSISIATMEYLREQGIDLARDVHLTAIDMDEKCVHMAFVQLSLLWIPATVIHGNALSDERREVWHTPALLLAPKDRRSAAA